jgi:hypothetical protein
MARKASAIDVLTANLGSRLICCFALSLLAGCAGNADSAAGAGGGPSESVSTEGEAIGTTQCPSNASYKNMCTNGPGTAPGGYASDGYPFYGPSVNDFICWPTEFDGTSSNAKPNFVVSQQNGSWYGSGDGYMACIPRCCFTSAASGAVEWLSGTFSAAASSSGSNVGSQSTQMWWGDSMPFISGLWHINNGMTASDYGMTDYTSPTVAVNLTARSYHTSNVVTTGFSYFVGPPHAGHVVNVSPPHGQTPYQAYAGHLQQMIYVSQGVCAYTYLPQLDGGNYFAQIYATSDGHYWMSSTTSAAVQARCYYYNQGNN